MQHINDAQDANAALEKLKSELPRETLEILTEVIQYHIAMSSFDISAGGQVSELNCSIEEHSHNLEKSFKSLFLD